MPRGIGVPLALGAVVLAADPVLWLIDTWLDPAYASVGGYVMVLVMALYAWSVSSPLAMPSRAPRTSPWPLLLLLSTAGIRLLGRLTATNVIGAAALVVDIYALALLARVGERRRAVSPGWLALTFAFALPLERILLRTSGFLLQQIATAGACGVLGVGGDDVRCFGTRIAVAGRDVMVDLPCSGARGVLQLLLLFAVLATLTRPRWPRALAGLLVTVASGLLGNTLRVAWLAAGMAYPPHFGGEPIDVMAQPWHDVIGVVCLALAAVPLLVWAKKVPPAVAATASGAPLMARRGSTGRWTPARAVAFAMAAIAVVLVPEQPLDVGASMPPPALPLALDGAWLDPLPLTDKERDYYAVFGGGAVKGRYGNQTLLLVATTSPLRHLHAPDECLAGGGHVVERLGLDFNGPLPAAIYRSVAPDGAAYRVAVTYVSDRESRLATSVAEVVWHWLREPGEVWTAIERISRWETPAAELAAFDAAVVRAFELNHDVSLTLSTRGDQ